MHSRRSYRSDSTRRLLGAPPPGCSIAETALLTSQPQQTAPSSSTSKAYVWQETISGSCWTTQGFCILQELAQHALLCFQSCRVRGSCPLLMTWPDQKPSLVEGLKATIKSEASVLWSSIPCIAGK